MFLSSQRQTFSSAFSTSSYLSWQLCTITEKSQDHGTTSWLIIQFSVRQSTIGRQIHGSILNGLRRADARVPTNLCKLSGLALYEVKTLPMVESKYISRQIKTIDIVVKQLSEQITISKNCLVLSKKLSLSKLQI